MYRRDSFSDRAFLLKREAGVFFFFLEIMYFLRSKIRFFIYKI